ncbi:MAG TPA: NUDIX domain-containing protein [Patescibacteria group bacterium]|nr:NUDIX domain-containing protein [Patescibacteria group bacterium]
MKREFSAGGIVYKHQRKAKSEQRITKWLICQHSHHKGWVFPKGLIGDTIDNESREDTSVREVKEETGIDAEIVHEAPIVTKYWYQFNKEKIFKTVYFYLMKHKGGDFKDHDHEMMDVKWVTEEEVKKTLTYNNDRKAFEEALKIYHQLT